MGCASRHARGADAARELARDITSEGARRLFLSGVNGEPKPKVRAAQPTTNKIEWTPEIGVTPRCAKEKALALSRQSTT
jgi:hypothetical protein